MSEPTVAAVIPIHNGLPHVLACLESLEASSLVPDPIVVVDHGSTDGSGRAIREAHPRVRLVPGSGDLWWSGAMNLGVRHALAHGVRFVLSINHDCRVERDAVASLVDRAERWAPAIVCSRVRYWPDDGRLRSAGGEVNWWWRGPRLRGGDERDDVRWDAPALVDWVPGMGVLVPRRCFEAIGLYDERRFPHYKGDIDFSLRARNAGFRLVYEPRSVVWNDARNSGVPLPARFRWRDVRDLLTSRRSQFNVEETVRLFARHSPLPAFPFGVLTRYAALLASLAVRSVRAPVSQRVV